MYLPPISEPYVFQYQTVTRSLFLRTVFQAIFLLILAALYTAMITRAANIGVLEDVTSDYNCMFLLRVCQVWI
jgi:hypothetical protein